MSNQSIAEQPGDSSAKAAQSPPRKRRELLSIQYMRAIAAVAVLVFHAADRAGTSFGVGAAGVDIFFVISGFIMWVITARDPLRPAQFLARRAARIVPLYWLVTLAVAGTALALPPLFPNLRPTLGHVGKSLLFYPHADPSGLIAPLIVPGWTLNYEVFFYAVFAISLSMAVRIRAFALTAVLGFFVLSGHWAPSSDPAWSTYTSPLLLEFLSGVWLGKAWTDGLLPRPIVGFSSLAVGVASMVVVTAAGIDIEPVRLLAWGVPAFLIVAGAVSLDWRGLVPDWPILKFLGDASYSIYLVHGLAISFCARVLAMIGMSAAPVILLVSVIGGLAVGSGCYQFVERPLMRFFHRARPKHVAVATPVAAAFPVELPGAVSAHSPDAV
ncbi:MAG TPA: acyltransferase [Stellaceae bacterium]|nr:acyltransferase [Stellaceae bacterium]